MKKYSILCVSCLFFMTARAQQDPQYSLYQFNQMVINPAYAGARDAIAVVMDMRKQWVGISGSPTTLAFSIHAPVLNNKLGLGLNVVSDQIGAKSVTGAYGNFAYIAKLNNRYKLSFGLRAGYLNYNFNYSKISYKDANETAFTDLSNTNKGVLDMDAGLFLKSNTFFAGISATHLTGAKLYDVNYTVTNSSGASKNVNSSYILNSHTFIVVSKAFVINENFVFNPTVLLKSVSSTGSLDINLNVLIKQRMWLGTFIRQGNGVGFLFQVYATDKLRIGYAYDLRRVLGASHEIMLGFDFGNFKAKMLSPRFL